LVVVFSVRRFLINLLVSSQFSPTWSLIYNKIQCSLLIVAVQFYS
jgi:hypothetical protein